MSGIADSAQQCISSLNFIHTASFPDTPTGKLMTTPKENVSRVESHTVNVYKLTVINESMKQIKGHCYNLALYKTQQNLYFVRYVDLLAHHNVYYWHLYSPLRTANEDMRPYAYTYKYSLYV